MSKLKTAQAIQKSFTIAGVTLKWLAIAFAVIGVCTGLWAWANAHFLSFAIVIGIVVLFFAAGGLCEAWDWSKKTIEEAKQEEAEEQARERAEKRRQELREQMPAPRSMRTIPNFEDDFYH
jgi:Sec-independent protein translocase protein TatA